MTATIHNTGDVPTDVEFLMPLDSGLTLASYTTDGVSGDINGQSVTATDLSTGVPAGALGAGGSRTVVLTLNVVGPPGLGTAFHLYASWAYSYVSCTAKPPIDAVWPMPLLTVDYETPDGGAGGTAGQAGAASGGASGSGNSSGSGGNSGTGNAASGGQSGGGGSGAKSNGNASSGDDGGCSCSTPSTERFPGALVLWALGLILGLGRARRRSRR